MHIWPIIPFSGDGQCFITTHNCTGANRNLESEEECCLGNGLSYSNGLACQVCYGKHTNVCENVVHVGVDYVIVPLTAILLEIYWLCSLLISDHFCVGLLLPFYKSFYMLEYCAVTGKFN